MYSLRRSLLYLFTTSKSTGSSKNSKVLDNACTLIPEEKQIAASVKTRTANIAISALFFFISAPLSRNSIMNASSEAAAIASTPKLTTLYNRNGKQDNMQICPSITASTIAE
jgi:hypothetical protein